MLDYSGSPKAVEPNKQLAMKHENTVPKGIVEPAPNFEAWIAALMAGGHCNTKIYIAPAKNVPIRMMSHEE